MRASHIDVCGMSAQCSCSKPCQSEWRGMRTQSGQAFVQASRAANYAFYTVSPIMSEMMILLAVDAVRLELG